MITARFALAAVPVGQHVAAAADRRDLRGVRFWNGTFWRVNSRLDRAVLALDRGDPRDGGLDRVARTPDIHVRDETQARGVLDRLVRRAVLAEPDRIVREHEDRRAAS